MSSTVAWPALSAALVLLVGRVVRRIGTGGAWWRRSAGELALLARCVRHARRLSARALGVPLGGGSADASGEVLRLCASVASGGSLLLALRDLAAGDGPWSEPAARACGRVEAGAGIRPAVDAWAEEARDPAVRLLADALAIAASTGGSQVRSLDAVLVALRDRAALEREVRALSSQARASAWVLVATPLAFAGAIALTDRRVRSVYVSSALGLGCITTGCVLDLAGAWWMARLVRRVS